jgi:4-hydroxy-tetrahydrodipicolinate synthase
MLPPGVYPASVTPMTPDGKVDLPGVVNLLAHFRTTRCQGIVLSGTNGEGPSLSAVEKRDLVRTAVPIFPDFPVIAGIATPSLEEAIWLAQQAHKAGAGAGLVMAPSYFREATESGISAWFQSLFEATELPILVYNFPQRTGITITPAMMTALGSHQRMIGLKDSSGDESNIEGYAKAFAGTGKQMFVGNEGLLWKALEAGWSGTISGAANSIPGWLSRIVHEFTLGDQDSASAKFQLAKPVIEALRKLPHPAIHKAVLADKGVLASSALRLPLEPPTGAQVREALDAIQGFV